MNIETANQFRIPYVSYAELKKVGNQETFVLCFYNTSECRNFFGNLTSDTSAGVKKISRPELRVFFFYLSTLNALRLCAGFGRPCPDTKHSFGVGACHRVNALWSRCGVYYFLFSAGLIGTRLIISKISSSLSVMV